MVNKIQKAFYPLLAGATLLFFLSFQVTANGTLDMDRASNGEIVGPVGLAVRPSPVNLIVNGIVAHLPRTGQAIWLVVVSAVAMILVGASLPFVQQKRSRRQN
ncbi:hypothetical protein KBC31_02065 [Candidatus Saccharibacteria bacterium]|nr:hypothetical protein [Candidatus Saccharibacteria bacterium]